MCWWATLSGTCLRQIRPPRLFRTWRGDGSLAASSPTPPARPSRPRSAMATIRSATGFNGDFSMDFASLIPGCNPIHGGVNYLNTNCFTPPTAPASLPPATAGESDRLRAAFVSAPTSRPARRRASSSARTCLATHAATNSMARASPRWTSRFSRTRRVPKISETFNVQFRAEFFNILNHTNFIGPNFLNGSQNNSIFDFNGSRAADRAESNVHVFTADSTRIEAHLVIGGLA